MQPSISPGPRSQLGSRPATYLDLAGPGQRSCLVLHLAGFTWPLRHRSAGALLPHHFTLTCAPRSYKGAIGGVFLLHFPAGFPGWALPTAMPFGVRTFLEPEGSRSPGLHRNGSAALPEPRNTRLARLGTWVDNARDPS